MLVRYCLHARTVLPLTLYGYVGYYYHSTDIRLYIRHGHRRYWPVTWPDMFGIAPYSLGVRRCHHGNMSLATNFQFRFNTSDSTCANLQLLFLLKPWQDISGIPNSLLYTIDFHWWDYCANISHSCGINYILPYVNGLFIWKQFWAYCKKIFKKKS